MMTLMYFQGCSDVRKIKMKVIETSSSSWLCSDLTEVDLHYHDYTGTETGSCKKCWSCSFETDLCQLTCVPGLLKTLNVVFLWTWKVWKFFPYIVTVTCFCQFWCLWPILGVTVPHKVTGAGTWTIEEKNRYPLTAFSLGTPESRAAVLVTC